jgi:anti-sigma factor RsiW
MKMFNVVENWALHAFADGELEGDEREAVENLLASSDEARKALTAIQFQKSELHRVYDDVIREDVPTALINTALQAGKRNKLPYSAMAASLALILIGGASGWFAAQNSETLQAASLERRALIAHEVFSVEVRHPFEVAAAEQEHLQKWLSKRVGGDVKIPNLENVGYTLLGGRLLAGESSPAGQLMYETANKDRLTVFISANEDGKDEALRLEGHASFVTCYWRDGKLAMAVTSEMSKDAMMILAKNIYEQMEVKI